MTDAVRVLIAEDHELFRRGLVDLLSSEGFEVVGVASTADDVLALAIELEPDVLLIDTDLEGGAGLEATRAVRQASPDVRIVALTTSRERGQVLTTLRAGADGYLTKDQLARGPDARPARARPRRGADQPAVRHLPRRRGAPRRPAARARRDSCPSASTSRRASCRS